MTRRLLALLFVAVLPLAAHAHFVWLLPAKDAAQLVFSDSLEPDSPDLLKKISHIELFAMTADGKTTPLKGTMGKESLDVAVPGDGPRVVAGVCPYGVVQRGSAEPFLLHYYPKTFVGGVVERRCDRLPLEIVPTDGSAKVLVLWQGKPLVGAEVALLIPGEKKERECKSDDDGLVTLNLPKGATKVGVRARHTEAKAGEHDGKKYKEVRHYATLVLEVR